MSECLKDKPISTSPNDHFVAKLMPVVKTQARIVFRQLPQPEREEATQGAIAIAFAFYADLVAKQKLEKLFPSKLADFACRHVRCGRILGGRLNSREVLAPKAQRKHRFTVTPFSAVADESSRRLSNQLDGHRRYSVLDRVAFLIDYPKWLASLPKRARQAARALSMGEMPSQVADRLAISRGRISQLRCELRQSWHRFHGEPVPTA